MTFSEMQTMCALLCGNIKSSHPLFVMIGGDSTHKSLINIAANRFVRMYAAKLPEMLASWTVGPTVAANNAANTLPSDLLAVYDVSVAHQATTPNWSTTRTYPMTFVTQEEFDYLDKSRVDYPIICTKVGLVIKVWPTPDATTIAYMRWYGLMEETALVNASDTFFMHADWHPLVAKFAASLLEEMRGNDDRARTLMSSVEYEMEHAKDFVAEENLGKPSTISVLGAPTRETVHG